MKWCNALLVKNSIVVAILFTPFSIKFFILFRREVSMEIQSIGLEELKQLIDSLDYDLSDLYDIEILAACTGTCSTCNGVCQKCNAGASNGNSR